MLLDNFDAEVKESLLPAMVAAGIVSGDNDAKLAEMTAIEAAQLLASSDVDVPTCTMACVPRITPMLTCPYIHLCSHTQTHMHAHRNVGTCVDLYSRLV